MGGRRRGRKGGDSGSESKAGGGEGGRGGGGEGGREGGRERWDNCSSIWSSPCVVFCKFCRGEGGGWETGRRAGSGDVCSSLSHCHEWSKSHYVHRLVAPLVYM